MGKDVSMSEVSMVCPVVAEVLGYDDCYDSGTCLLPLHPGIRVGSSVKVV